MIANKTAPADHTVRLGVKIAAALAAVGLVIYLREVLTPFGIALTLAYLFNPLVNRVQRQIGNRTLAVLCTLLGVAVVYSVCSYFILQLVINEMRQSGDLLEIFLTNKEIIAKAKDLITPNMLQQLQAYVSQQNLVQLLQQQQLTAVLKMLTQHVVPQTWSVFSSVIGLILGIVGMLFIALYTVFILIDFDTIKNGIRHLFPTKIGTNLQQTFHIFMQLTHRYFRAQLYICMILTALFAAGFKLIGLPMAVTLASLVGLLNMVPYFSVMGMIPATVLAALQALKTGQSFVLLLLLVVAVFVAIQIIQDTLLTPNILGRSTGLSPALLLLSISIWGKLLGFLGLILAIPLSCLLVAVYSNKVVGTAGLEPATSTV